MARNAEIVRQWRILREIETSRAVTIANLAATCEVCTRTIRRDLDALQEAGFPLYDETIDGKAYWRLRSKPFRNLGDTSFTVSELCAFYLARTQLGGAQVLTEELKAAFDKIAAALGPRLRAYLDRLPQVLAAKTDPPVRANPRVLNTVARALVEATIHHRTIEMSYHSFSSGREKAYRVEPYRLTTLPGGLYLFAYVPDYGQMRTFAAHRIRRVKVTDQHFNPVQLPSDSPYSHSLGVFTGKPEPVEIEFAAAVAPYIEERQWHRSQEIVRRRDGSLLLRLQVCVDPALKTWILGFGHQARVKTPARLADMIFEELEEAREQYVAQTASELTPSLFHDPNQADLGFS